MATKPLKELADDTTHDVEFTEYTLIPGEPYVFSMNGVGVWGYWDGVAYVAFTAGSGKNLRGYAPQSGKVRVHRTSGTVTAGFILSPR